MPANSLERKCESLRSSCVENVLAFPPAELEKEQQCEKFVERASSEVSSEVVQHLRALKEKYGFSTQTVMVFAWHKILKTWERVDAEPMEVVTSLGAKLALDEQCFGRKERLTIREVLQIVDQDLARVEVGSVNWKGSSALLFKNEMKEFPTNTEGFVIVVREEFEAPGESKDGAQLILQAIGCPSCVDDAQALAVLKRIELVLEAIARGVDEPHQEIQIILEEETKMMETLWKGANEATFPAFDEKATLHKIFEERARKNPERIALVFGEETLTYAQLNTESKQIANAICEAVNDEVPQDALVVLFMDKGLEMITSTMGILKAGAAYMPIAPSYPKSRVTFMLEDSSPIVILATAIHEATIMEHAGESIKEGRTKLLVVGRDTSSCPTTPLNKPRTGADLAYIMYTSGTTGKPKGVLVPHRGVTSLLIDTDYVQLNEDDVFLQIANPCFDAATLEIWGALLLGGKLVIPHVPMNDAEVIEGIMRKHGVSAGFFTKTLFDGLLAQRPDMFSKMRFLLVGGEALNADLVRKLVKSPDCCPMKLLNGYGPTESTTFATFFDCASRPFKGQVPLGRPIRSRLLCVVDECLHLLPTGAPGELLIGGHGLARGYLGRPELTAQRFINLRGERWYRTGDIVRWTAIPGDKIAQLEFLGRNDGQVKIRGFRVELGEIESALQAIPLVKQCAVVDLVDPRTKAKYLAAYVVRSEEEKASQGESDADIEQRLRDRLGAKMPSHMIPSAFAFLDTIPLNQNGKLDKRALPDPRLLQLGNDSAKPKDDLEEKLCEIWAQVLGLPVIGTRDHFFRIGGDSIISIQLLARLREACFSVRSTDIIECPTVEKLAQHLRDVGANGSTGPVIRTEEGILEGTFPLVPVQCWFLELNLQNWDHFNQAFMLTVPNELSEDALRKALFKLSAHHDMLRCVLRDRKQVFLPQLSTIEIEVLDGKDATEEELTKRQAMIALDGPNPTWRIVLIHNFGQNKNESRVNFMCHHAYIDSVSWRILATDLRRALQGEDLPAKTSSFRQWAEALEKYEENHPDEAAYWERVLSSSKSIDLEPNAEPHHRGIETDAKLSDDLLRNANPGFHTEINDLLLAALSMALREAFTCDDALILLEGHGREDIDASLDVSRTVGWFTTLFPVRISARPNVEDTIILTKERQREIPNKGIGYGAIMQNKNGNSVIPNIVFNYLGQFDNDSDGNLWKVTGWSDAALFQVAGEACGIGSSFENRDEFVLNINGEVRDSRLKFDIYSQLSKPQTERFAGAFETALRSVASAALKSALQGGVRTPHDFPFAKHLTLEHLESINEKLSPVEYILPANSLQQGLLQHWLAHPEDDAYSVQMVIDYENLNVMNYRAAWQATLSRYPALRAAFDWEGDEILQVICKEAEITFEKLRKEHVRIRDLVAIDRQRPHNLGQPAPLRVTLLEPLDASDRVTTALITLHHIVIDGWSIALLFKSVHEAYDKIDKTGAPSVTLTIDEAFMDATSYNARQAKACSIFWDEEKKLLEQANDLRALCGTNVDLDCAREVSEPEELGFGIHGNVFQNLKAACSKEATTLSAVVQFGLHKLLEVYTGDLVTIIGTTVSGRDVPVSGIESSVGLYINTLPIGVQWNDSATIKEILGKVQHTVAQVSKHSFTNLSEIQREGKRLFHMLYVYQFLAEEKAPSGLAARFKQRDLVEKTDYPLTVLSFEHKERMEVKLKFDASIVSNIRAEGILNQLRSILEWLAAVEWDKTSHKDAILMNVTEEKIVLRSWNMTDAPFGVGSICDMIQEQAACTPEAPAVSFEGEILSFCQLEKRADSLANHLRETFRVQPGSFVGLYLEPSLEMVVCILGILKSGAAYVPISVDYPNERTALILDDTGSNMVLTQNKFVRMLGEVSSARLLTVESLSEIPASGPVNFAKPEHLAYVIYTSGTTGRPKGVMVDHEGVLSFAIRNRYSSPEVVVRNVASLSPHSFDGFIYDLFFSLFRGACMHLFPRDIKLNQELLCDALAEAKVDSMFVTTALFNQLVQSGELRKTQLRQILFGGEAANLGVVRIALKDYPDIQFIHVYGPTETIVYATAYHFPKNCNLKAAPIGSALHNKRLYVLDPRGRPVPVGAPGELFIGGSGIAKGYLNRDDLTAERFVENPFATEEDRERGWTRMYKTGDVVRWLPDGNVEFIGRNDSQVKVRGFRIELGEVECAIDKLEMVKQSVVMTREDASSSRFLVGYVVAAEGKAWDVSKAREELLVNLPEYMIPSVFLEIEAIPLNVNGKVDHRALPEPSFEGGRDEYAEPVTEMDKILCEAFTKVLPVDQVGIKDNFYRLGGNSINAIRLVGLCRREYCLEIPLMVLLQSASVGSLAKTLEDAAALGGQRLQSQSRQSMEKTEGLDDEDERDYSRKWPLSKAQERLLFIDRLDEAQSCAYHIPYLVRLEFDADLNKLERALELVVRKHSILRTAYRSDAGEPYQQLLRKKVTLQKVECEGGKVHAVASEEMGRPFNLATDSPMRACIIQTGSERYFLLVWHHIAFDGWSLPLFFSDLRQAYETQKRLPPLALQYQDYAERQRKTLKGKVFTELLEYWTNHLQGFEPLNLPADKPKKAIPDYKGRDIHVELDLGLSNKLRDLSRTNGTTLYTLLLSVFYVTLANLTGQTDIVIGSPSENRMDEDTHDVIGFFVSVLPLRMQIEFAATLRAFVQRVHEMVLNAKVRQEVPLKSLIDSLKLDRDSMRQPIFNVMFSVQSFDEDSDMPSIFASRNVAWENNVYSPAKFDLSFFVNDGGKRLSVDVNFATAVFEDSTVVRIVDVFQQVASEFLQMEKVIKDVNPLSSIQRSKVLQEWNSARICYPQDCTIMQWFENRVAVHPDRDAIVFEGHAMTYRELNSRANQIARALRIQVGSSLQAGSLIGLFMDKGLDMLAAILGVLKAGGAYVPIAPAYPEERVNYMLQDAKAVAMVANHKFIEKLRTWVDGQQVLIAVENTRAELTGDLPPINTASDLAYVIYTSGTTGKPKGVKITHRNVAHLVVSQGSIFNADKYERALLFAAFVFDASISEIFVSLYAGHTLFIASEAERRDTLFLSNLVQQNNIQLATIPPSLLQVMQAGELSSLRHLVVAGESPALDVLQRFTQNGTNVMNAYGPTEGTVCATGHIWKYGDTNTNIGGPIPNVQLYVLNQHSGKPAPIGAPGELYIAGDGLSTGYLNRPDLTSERFVDNLFQEGQKMYKTGDVVRWLPSGELEFLGRADHQVKIKGFRIELGEIENVLNALEGVTQSVVVACGKGTASPFLAAYFVGEAAPSTLLKGATAQLPDYMLPRCFMKLESVPMTINGKVDTRALPPPDLSNKIQEEEGETEELVEPSTELEKKICEVWKIVLGNERIGVNDNFFRIGGDSIVSIQLVSKLRQNLGLTVLVRHIFEAPTISKLAMLMSNNTQMQVEVISEQGTLEGDFQLLPIQSQFFEKGLAVPNHWNQSFTVRIPRGTYTLEDLSAAVCALAVQHDVMRLTISKDMDSQTYSADVPNAKLSTLDVSKMSSRQVHEVLTSWQAKFDIYEGPLWNAAHLTGFNDGCDRIWFAFHHMIVDTVSWRIIADDMHSILTGEGLPSKTTSYRQWIQVVHGYAAENVDQVEYWESVFEGFDAEIGSERLKAKEIRHTEVSLLEDRTKELLRNAGLGYNTEINDLLLAALAEALSVTFGGRQINHITLESTGRERDVDDRVDLSRTVGWFTSAYPVKLEKKANIEETIINTKESLRAIPQKGIGFGILRMLDSVQHGLPPIIFNYLGQFNNVDIVDKDAPSLWAITSDDAGTMIPKINEDQDVILSINGGVMEDGRLRFFVDSLLDADQLRIFARSFEDALLQVISQCKHMAEEGGLHTPSDFGVNGLSMNVLRSIQAKIHIEEIFLATSLQQGFVHHALSSDVDVYNVQMTMIYDKIQLDEHAYEQAWQSAVDSYPALRTAFDWSSGVVVQIIAKKVNLDCEFVDLSSFEDVEQQKRLERIEEEQHQRPFNLRTPGLLRISIVRLEKKKYAVVKTIHHSVFDGWSESNLMRTVHNTYDRMCASKEGHVEVDLSYIEAQKYFASHVSESEEYWSKYVMEEANDIKIFESAILSVDSSVDLNCNRNPSDVEIEISSDLTSRIRKLCRVEAVTPSSTLLFAWHTVMREYSQSDQTIVGTVVSGRELPVDGIEESVGLYINTLPHKVDWTKELLSDPVAAVRDVNKRTAELNQNSNVSLTKLQAGGQRLFHSLYVFENFPGGNEEATGIAKHVRIGNTKEATDYPLCLSGSETPSGNLALKISFDRSWMREQTVNSLLSQMVEVLGGLSAKENPKLSPALPKLNISFPFEGMSLVDVFEKRVADVPGNEAVAFDGGLSLTYSDLKRRATALAAVIGAQQADTKVGLYLTRSADMIVAMQGVLKTGAAYVPMAPEHPQDRIAYILEDTGLQTIVCAARFKERLLQWTRGTALKIIVMEEIDPKEADKVLNLPKISPNSLAYVIYTSGTTGKPKGVMIEHRNVLVYASAFSNLLSGAPVQRIDFSSNYTFDLSVSTSLVPTLMGWTICVYGGEISNIPSYRTHLQEKNVDLVSTTPRLAEVLLRGEEIKNVRTVLLGGEKITPECLSRISPHVERIYDEYGPTEATVACTAALIRPRVQRGIGKAYPNYEAFILDENLNEVPRGALGELVIGGAALARGYLNREDLTREKFTSWQGRRIYRTGDLVRMLDSGDIEYIGRNDTQVKIRGYRVELGEIEVALNDLPEIASSAVIDRKENGETVLCAYIVAKDSTSDVSLQEVEKALRERLPSYMVPTAFGQLAEIPVTIAGKLDRKSLPILELYNRSDFAAPQNATERAICAVWESVLGQAQVGIHDSFFELGGNSIMAIRLSARMQEQLGLKLPIGKLYELQTVAALAAMVEENGGISAEAVTQQKQKSDVLNQLALKRIKEGADKFPLSFAQQQMLFLSRFGDNGTTYHIPMLVELAQGAVIDALVDAFAFMTEKHVILRTVYRTDENGNDYQQILEDDFATEPTVAIGQDADWRAVLAEALQRPFNLAEEPPMRVHSFYFPDGNGWIRAGATFILIVWHHIAFDGWSSDLFMNDLAEAYAMFKKSNEAPALPDVSSQYADYAVWQRSLLQGETLMKLVGFWTEQLSGFSNLELPTDRPRTTGLRDAAGENIYFHLEEGISNSLRTMAKSQSTTLYTLMLSAYYVTLAILSGQTDLVVGSPSENRGEEETQTMIGFFVNLVALRLEVNFNETVSELVSRTHMMVASAKQHQELPFERLVDAMEVERNTGYQPIVQTTFSVQSFEQAEREPIGELPFLGNDVFAEELISMYTPAKHDLSMSLDDSQAAIEGCLLFAKALFNRSSMESFLHAYKRVLETFAKNGTDLPLREVNVLEPKEVSLILDTWNATKKDYGSRMKPLHKLFEERAAMVPNEVALVFEDTKMTYGELDARSNQVAHAIRCEHAGEQFVGLYLDRGIDMIVGIVGILKAGAAYVPIAPSYPEDRVKFMVEDASIKIIVSQWKYEEKLKVLGVAALMLNEQFFDGTDSEPAPPRNAVHAHVEMDDLAYVIYTSGTTGRPKGVMIEHRNVVNFVLAKDERLGISKHKRALQFASYVFDASIFDVWPLLIGGSTIYIANDNERLDTSALSSLIRKNEITWAHVPPSRLHGMEPEAIECMKSLVVGGEAPPQQVIDLFRSSGMQVINCYGPTETTVTVTAHEYRPGDSASVIGTPNANTVMYLFNQHTLKPVPMGAPGELYVGGAGVSRGYLNRPDKTAEAFVENPFKDRDGYDRLYKTGDIMRWLPGGTLEYMGRADAQIKVKGFRIELSEIQVVLDSLPSVRCSIVTSRKGKMGNYVIAYVVPDRAEEFDEDSIVNNLRNTLPDYMVPSSITKIDKIPLTINGKVDISALPAPGIASRKRAIKMPRNDVEEDICALWKSILGLEEVSVDDDFFRVGGDSILSSQVVSKLRQKGYELMVGDIFTYPTIAKLAKHLLAQIEDKKVMERRGSSSNSADHNHSNTRQTRMTRRKSTATTSAKRAMLRRMSTQQKVGIRSNMSRRISSRDVAQATTDPILQKRRAKEPLRLLRRFVTSVATKQYIFMIHPSGSGAEVYAGLARELQDRFNCKGIDNLNLVMENRTGDLRKLAETYIELIQSNLKSRDVSDSSPIVLLGWSLGGKIALEIAAQLEADEKRDICVVLLDAFLRTEAEIADDIEPSEETVRKMMLEAGVAADIIDDVMKATKYEDGIAHAELSGPLKYTKAILFKAMLPSNSINQEYFEMWRSRIESSPDNGISRAISAANITIHHMYESNHYNMLQNAKFIAKNIEKAVFDK